MREREEERERELEEETENAKRPKSGSAAAAASSSPTARPAAERLPSLIAQAEPIVEQLNSLYNQYIAGIEKRPPLERRKHLDQLIATILSAGKPTPALQFRCQTLLNHYQTHRDRWDKMMRDLELGKIKRPGGK